MRFAFMVDPQEGLPYSACATWPRWQRRPGSTRSFDRTTGCRSRATGRRTPRTPGRLSPRWPENDSYPALGRWSARSPSGYRSRSPRRSRPSTSKRKARGPGDRRRLVRRGQSDSGSRIRRWPSASSYSGAAADPDRAVDEAPLQLPRRHYRLTNAASSPSRCRSPTPRLSSADMASPAGPPGGDVRGRAQSWTTRARTTAATLPAAGRPAAGEPGPGHDPPLGDAGLGRGDCPRHSVRHGGFSRPRAQRGLKRIVLDAWPGPASPRSIEVLGREVLAAFR